MAIHTPRSPSPWPRDEVDSSPRISQTVERQSVLPGTRPSGFMKSVLAAAPRYTAGDSPFHVKGHIYRSSFGYYNQVVPGGVAAVLERVDPLVRPFFEQHFLTASWYDALPLFPLSVAAAQVRGVPYHAAMVERARIQAEADIHGIYRVILDIASPETLAPRIGRAVMKYFNYGEAVSRMSGDRLCELTHAGVPMPLVPLCAPLAEGYLLEAFTQAGAKGMTFKADAPERDGEFDGTPTYLLRFWLGWLG